MFLMKESVLSFKEKPHEDHPYANIGANEHD